MRHDRLFVPSCQEMLEEGGNEIVRKRCCDDGPGRLCELQCNFDQCLYGKDTHPSEGIVEMMFLK